MGGSIHKKSWSSVCGNILRNESGDISWSSNKAFFTLDGNVPGSCLISTQGTVCWAVI